MKSAKSEWWTRARDETSGIFRHQIFSRWVPGRRAVPSTYKINSFPSTPLLLNHLEKSIWSCKYASYSFATLQRRSWTVLHAVMTHSMPRRMTLTLCRSPLLAFFSSEKTTTVSEQCKQLTWLSRWELF